MTASEMSDSNQSEKSQEQAIAVDYEQFDEVLDMLKASPLALPLSVEDLSKHGVKVSDIPKGLLLSEYVGDLEVRVGKAAPMVRHKALDLTPRKENTAEGVDSWVKSKSLLIIRPRNTTNRRVKPSSRFFIRGILHPKPYSFYIGAVATFLIVWLVPAALFSMGLLILASKQPDDFEWVSPQLYWVIGALFMMVVLYIRFGFVSVCPVCKQRLLIYRSRLINNRRHHLPRIDGLLRLCLHVMVFRWFHCKQCNTSVRLKK